MRASHFRSTRGFTLLELLVVVAVTGILLILAVRAILDLDRTRKPRELVAALQGGARAGLQQMRDDIRAASLSSSTGVVWQQDSSGNRAARPAIQIFENVQGGSDAVLDAKQGTDALLVVRADPVAFPVTLVDHFTSVSSGPFDLAVAPAGLLRPAAYVLVGQWGDVGWDQVAAADGETVALAATVNILPPFQNGTRLPAGSVVRPARARIYFVNNLDQLVRADLRVARAPSSSADVIGVTLVAPGIENLQIDCEMDPGGVPSATLAPCPLVLDSTDPIAKEAAKAFATGGGQGPRMTAASVASVRMVRASLVARGERPLLDANQGDPPIALDDNRAVTVESKPHVRRAYRINVAVRNVALGAL